MALKLWTLGNTGDLNIFEGILWLRMCGAMYTRSWSLDKSRESQECPCYLWFVVSDIKQFPSQTVREFRFQEAILFPAFDGWPFNTRNRFKLITFAKIGQLILEGVLLRLAYQGQGLRWEKFLTKNYPLANNYTVFRIISLLLEHAFCARFSLFTDCDSE